MNSVASRLSGRSGSMRNSIRLIGGVRGVAAAPSASISSAAALNSASGQKNHHGLNLHMVSNLNSMADVEDYAIRQVVVPPPPIRPLVVVKVGGEVITKEPQTLTESLAFLKAQGLQPIVVHGGGPQLNDELAKAGVQPQYIGGHRVTDPATMAVAKKVFESANAELTQALVKGGLEAQQFTGGVFMAEVHDEKLGLVGQIKSVVTESIERALAAGKIPVLTSLGLSKATGSTLNINADVAARELAIALKPVRIVYISAGGGWKEEGAVVSEVNMASDYEAWVKRDYTGRQGTLLKLMEMKAIVDNLPPSSSVTIASAAALASQLLPHKGPGSQIRKGVKLLRFDSLGAADGVRLRGLLSACGDDSSKDGLRLLEDAGKASSVIERIIATEDWSAAAIVTKAKAAGDINIPVLHTFALSPQAYWEGTESALWKEVIAAYPQGVAWLARDSRLPTSYNTTTMGGAIRGAAEAAAKSPASLPSLFPALSVRRSSQYATASVAAVGVCPATSVMFRGPSDSPFLKDFTTTTAQAVMAHVTGVSSSSSAGATVTSGASKPASPTFKKSSNPLKVGLLGARGYVGRELVRLIGQHPDLQVTCASSRAFKGQDVLEALGVTDAAQAVAPGLRMSDVGPEQIRKGLAPEVDVWVLALPNGLCAEHAAAIEHNTTANQGKKSSDIPLLVDLSADMRFQSKDSSWVYGMPERPGARDRIRTARKIANPGCYATGAQMALLPLLPQYMDRQPQEHYKLAWSASQKPHVFGISGYSGAGTTPSDKNDPDRLRDNILPYSLVNHIHEREVSYQCGLSGPNGGGIAFMPHVAPFFQGISLTVTGHLGVVDKGGNGGDLKGVNADTIARVYESFYKGERLVRVLGNDSKGKLDTPDVGRHGSLKHGVTVGGFTYDSATGRLALVSTLDNLLKGAATQALQNINLALGLEEYAGIPSEASS